MPLEEAIKNIPNLAPDDQLQVLKRFQEQIRTRISSGESRIQQQMALRAESFSNYLIGGTIEVFGLTSLPSDSWDGPWSHVTAAYGTIAKRQVKESLDHLVAAAKATNEHWDRLNAYLEKTEKGADRSIFVLQGLEAAGAVAATALTGGGAAAVAVGAGYAATQNLAGQITSVSIGIQSAIDWGGLAFDTLFGTLTGALGGKLGNALLKRLLTNKVAASLGRRVLAEVATDLVSGRLSSILQTAARTVFDQLRGRENLTMEQFIDRLIDQLLDPKAMFLDAIMGRASKIAHARPSKTAGTTPPSHMEPVKSAPVREPSYAAPTPEPRAPASGLELDRSGSREGWNKHLDEFQMVDKTKISQEVPVDSGPQSRRAEPPAAAEAATAAKPASPEAGSAAVPSEKVVEPATIAEEPKSTGGQAAAAESSAAGGGGGGEKETSGSGGSGKPSRKGQLTANELRELRAKDELSKGDVKKLAEHHGISIEEMTARLDELHQAEAVRELRGVSEGGGLVEPEIIDIPEAPSLSSPGELKRIKEVKGEGRMDKLVEKSIRARSRRNALAEFREAAADVGKQTYLTQESRENIAARGLEYMEPAEGGKALEYDQTRGFDFVEEGDLQKGGIARGLEESHLVPVKQEPAFAHKEASFYEPKEQHVPETHAANPAAELEALTRRGKPSPGFQMEQSGMPGVVRENKQILERMRSGVEEANRNALSAEKKAREAEERAKTHDATAALADSQGASKRAEQARKKAKKAREKAAEALKRAEERREDGRSLEIQIKQMQEALPQLEGIVQSASPDDRRSLRALRKD